MEAKRMSLILFAVFSFGLGILLGCDTHSKSVNAPKPAGEAQPLFTPVAASLAQQKMCDEQAGEKFKEYGYGHLDHYTSHYDPTVNVCYIRIHSYTTIPSGTTGEVVYDAFGGRELASYSWIYDVKKLPSEASPTECKIHVPGKSEEICKTQEEFDELTEKYFGVAR